MKKLVFGAIVLGFASLSYSQGSDCGKHTIHLTGVEVGPVNQNYLDEVGGESIAEAVYRLENEAARYKIEQSPSYDANTINGNRLNKTYDVQFSKPKGEILATYDRNGTIISTIEKYHDLTPPPAVRNSAFKEYPDWTLNSTAYTVSYNGNGSKKMYKIRLTKNREKKLLKFDVDGKRID